MLKKKNKNKNFTKKNKKIHDVVQMVTCLLQATSRPLQKKKKLELSYKVPAFPLG